MKRALIILGVGITVGFGVGMFVNATQDEARNKTKALVEKYKATNVKIVVTDTGQQK